MASTSPARIRYGCFHRSRFAASRPPTSLSSHHRVWIWRTNSRVIPRCFLGCEGRPQQGAHIAGTCTGAAYLAEAGLLDGHEATTHWATADDFRRRYPKVKWCPEKLITEDRRMLCSGGVYS